MSKNKRRPMNGAARPQQAPVQAVRIPKIVGVESAEVAYTDGCFLYGEIGGVIQCDLGSTVNSVLSDGTTTPLVKLTHRLRMSPAAAKNVIQGLEAALQAYQQKILARRAQIKAQRAQKQQSQHETAGDEAQEAA